MAKRLTKKAIWKSVSIEEMEKRKEFACFNVGGVGGNIPEGDLVGPPTFTTCS